jgi:shikimate O-hydroxycinnamoyltransferase
LAANWSHGVADGQSGFHFMKSWSELARGAEVSLLPDHQRDRLKPRDPLIPCDLVKAVAVSPDAQTIASKTKAEKDQSSETSPEAATSAAKTERKKVPIITRTAEITKDEITKLRKAAMDHPDPDTHLTRADCLSTHLWRTIARARNRPDDARVRLWILIEGRKKLNYPAGYFGNVVAMTPIITTVKELLHGPFGETAALIHSGIASITAEWFQGFVDLVKASAGKIMFAPEPLGPDSECGVSYLVRFPFYELDFGFGIPAFSIRNSLGAWDGLMFVLPSSRGLGHMVAMPNLQPDALSNFIAMAHDIPEAKP